jgi:uncharacterized surface protein with fasciclin (FAS1) repeats
MDLFHRLPFNALLPIIPRRCAALLAGLFALTFILAGCDSTDGGGGIVTPPTSEPTITALAGDQDDLTTLTTALGVAGLDGTLDDQSGTFTVFAPSDAAFDVYDVDFLTSNADLLSEVLGFHVVQGEAVGSRDLSEGDTFTTVQGDEITVSLRDGNVFVEGAQVTTADVEASNGVVHVIDDVLLSNRTAGERLQATKATESLVNAVDAAGLTEAFNDSTNTWTMFVPHNEAFVNAKLGDFTAPEIEQILKYHVIAEEVIDSEALLELLDENGGAVTIPTLQGEELIITQQDASTIIFNNDLDEGPQATLDLNQVDQRASNGILHVIDGILMPSSMGAMPEPTIADIVAENDDFSTLGTAVDAAGLTSALADEDASLTVFAPNNDGFAPINTDHLLADNMALTEVLQYHVLDQEIFAGDLAEGDNTVTTLAGDEITVTVDGGDIFIEGSQVIQTDIEADNGVVHVIDRTLLGNQDLAGVARLVAETERLFGAVSDFGLASAFADAHGWTVFGPNNDTFAGADLSGFTSHEVEQILKYHVIAEEVIDSEALLELLGGAGGGAKIKSARMKSAGGGGAVSVPTLQGEELTIALDGDQVVFNDGQATLDIDNLDYAASNGILHVIDGLLLPPSLQQPSITEVVSESSDFSTLATALGAVGLDATLGDENATFTVFAPANASFAPYDVDYLLDNPMLLEEVLGYHVVQGAAVFAGDLSDGDTFTTVQGDEIEVAIHNGDLFVEGAQVKTADIEASNGVVHVVDDVLLTNRTAVERATVTEAFSILVDLVGHAHLAEVLSGPGPDGKDGITVFAPTNEAFLGALDANHNGLIDNHEIPSNVGDILQYHVLDDVFFAAEVPTTKTALPTLQGAHVTVVRNGSHVAVNPDTDHAAVIAPDREVSNGVIHGINTVLTLPH